MKAMILREITDLKQNNKPLILSEMVQPSPKKNEILVKIMACGVCHTELDEIEGRTPPLKLPVILGHEIVGKVKKCGSQVKKFQIGDRIGIGWIFSSCGQCAFCQSGQQNLCKEFIATGRDVNGGYAEYITVPENFAFIIPEMFSDYEAAPFLCAGAIGYRSLFLTKLKNGQRLGLTGFGASAHLVLKMVQHQYPNSEIFVFARSERERKFAKELGAVWTGCIEEISPEKCDAIIDTTPVWKPVVEALKNLKNGGRLVINAIRKENIDKSYLLNLEYSIHLWMEKEIKSVANVTGQNIQEFIELASKIPIHPEIQIYAFEDANRAIMELKKGNICGAKVLKIS